MHDGYVPLMRGITLLGSLLLLAACSSAPEGPNLPKADGMGGHVHNLAYDGDALLIGTHEGLWRQEPGTVPSTVSQELFDVMGLAATDTSLLASGHPAAGSSGPSSIGLRRSTDGGVTWQTVALEGQADFHRLSASGSTLIGQNSHDGNLLMSKDDGSSWVDLGQLPFYDVAINPQDPQQIVGATPDGVARSTDGAASFAPVSGSPVLLHLSWTDGALYGVTDAGALFTSPDAGSTWTPVGTLEGEPIAITASGSKVAVLVGGTVYESADGGRTFAPRFLTGH